MTTLAKQKYLTFEILTPKITNRHFFLRITDDEGKLNITQTFPPAETSRAVALETSFTLNNLATGP